MKAKPKSWRKHAVGCIFKPTHQPTPHTLEGNSGEGECKDHWGRC